MSKPMSDTRPRQPRRRFDEEFKVQAVRLVLDEEKSVVGSVGRDLDLTETALREWVNRARAGRTKGKTGLTTAEREELTRLRPEDRRGCGRRDRDACAGPVQRCSLLLPRC